MTGADALFLEHRNGVFRYLCRCIGEADAARDLTQEVFLRVTKAVPVDTSGAGSRAWVFTIARNLALNYLRDRQRQPPVVEITDSAAPATQELAAALRQALAGLPEADRDVFLLRESAGLGYAEIAATCDLTPDAVRSRLHRARQQLRATLGAPLRLQLPRGVRLAD